MGNWNLIREWRELSPHKQLQTVFAIIILTLASVIVHYENKLSNDRKDHKSELKESREETRQCWQTHIRYVENSEKEYKAMALDVKNLKEKK